MAKTPSSPSPSPSSPSPSPSPVATVAVTALVPVAYDQRAIAVGETFDVRQADLAQLLGVQAAALASGD